MATDAALARWLEFGGKVEEPQRPSNKRVDTVVVGPHGSTAWLLALLGCPGPMAALWVDANFPGSRLGALRAGEALCIEPFWEVLTISG